MFINASLFSHNDLFSVCGFWDYITARICPFSCCSSPIVGWGLLAHAFCIAYSLLVVFSQKVLRHFVTTSAWRRVCFGTFRRFSVSVCAWIYLAWIDLICTEFVWEVATKIKIATFHLMAQVFALFSVWVWAASVVKHIRRTIEGSAQPGGPNPSFFFYLSTLYFLLLLALQLDSQMAFRKSADDINWRYVELYGNIMLHNSTIGLNCLCLKGWFLFKLTDFNFFMWLSYVKYFTIAIMIYFLILWYLLILACFCT